MITRPGGAHAAALVNARVDNGAGKVPSVLLVPVAVTKNVSVPA